MAEKSSYRAETYERLCEIIDRLEQYGIRRLPSEQQLAKKLQISRETLRSMLNFLEYEGRIFRLHGSGTFLNPRTKNAGLIYPCEDFGDVVRKNGYACGIRSLPAYAAAADEKTRELLQLHARPALCFPMLILADECPCILVLYYFDPQTVNDEALKYFGGEDHDILDMMDCIARCRGTRLLWDDVEMYAQPASALPENFRAVFADTLPDAFYMQDSLFFDTKNNPICFSRSYIDTTHIHFYMVRRWRQI